MKLLFIILSLVVLPRSTAAPEKLAFSLAEPDDVVKTENPKGLMGILHQFSQSSYVKDFMSLMNIMGSAAAADSNKPLPVARGVRIQNNNRRQPIALADSPGAQFEHSLSLDDAPQTAPAGKSSISKEEWAATLFGERGVLTGVFQMMDQQRKAQNTQSDSAPTINGKKLDLKEVFDSLLMGSKKGKLGDSGPELPEFLGICNRLSCGDIYKAIDKFRTSEFFSNFQTALGLIQDPNGWETIGKLLSNPELISQFTAGSGMEQLFGSALGEAKKESSKTQAKNSRLLPEDGDFGVDFSEDGDKEQKPAIDFNVDMKPETSDYYEEVSKGTNISPDYDNMEETVDVAPPPPVPTKSTATTTATTPSTIRGTVQGMKKPTMIEPGMPDISFSIDGPFEEGEVASVDAAPPPQILTKSVGASGRRPVTILTTTRRTTTRRITTVTTTRPTTRPTVRTTRWTPPAPTTPRPTTKNYRKDSDYYAMYYDDQSH